jgi:hypothetical protein
MAVRNEGANLQLLECFILTLHVGLIYPIHTLSANRLSSNLPEAHTTGNTS